jgi:hypothetical protein
MTRAALHHPSPDIDFILFPYEKLGCIVYDDPLAGLKAEELCEGADEVVRYWMRKLRTRRIALLSSPAAREGWTTFQHQGQTEDGWQIYTGVLGGSNRTMKLCPNFALYYSQTPKQLHFTAKPATDIPSPFVVHASACEPRTANRELHHHGPQNTQNTRNHQEP